MKTKAWGNLLLPLAPDRITTKPRERGLTMVIDRCQGLQATEDLLTLTGDYIDQIKLTFGTTLFVDEAVLRRKIELIRAHEIDIYPGGTLMEATLIQGVYPQYLRRAKELGFNAIEISDGTITMSRQIRHNAIKRALDVGLKVITEVGKKDPAIRLSPAEICDQIAGDLSVGADKVIIEARALNCICGMAALSRVRSLSFGYWCWPVQELISNPDLLVWIMQFLSSSIVSWGGDA